MQHESGRRAMSDLDPEGGEGLPQVHPLSMALLQVGQWRLLWGHCAECSPGAGPNLLAAPQQLCCAWMECLSTTTTWLHTMWEEPSWQWAVVRDGHARVPVRRAREMMIKSSACRTIRTVQYLVHCAACAQSLSGHASTEIASRGGNDYAWGGAASGTQRAWGHQVGGAPDPVDPFPSVICLMASFDQQEPSGP